MDVQNTEQIYLSVVTAAFNEEENVTKLLEEIHQACEKIGKPWEIVITNDCSEDNTLEILKDLKTKYPQLRILNQKKRSGQTAGWDAAIRAAKGYLVATMDADLQNNPAELPRMVEALEKEGVDMVNGWRKERNDPWIRLASTKIANGVRNWLTHEDIHDSACGLKLFKRHCMDRIKMYNGMHRFMPTLIKTEGYKVIEIPVHHRPRTAGLAKYGVWNRVFKAFRDTFAVRWMQSRVVIYEVEELEN